MTPGTLGPLETECRERRASLGVVGSCGRRSWALGALGVGVRSGGLGGSESGLDEAMAACPPSVREMGKA